LTYVEDIVTSDVSNQIHHPHKYLGFANVNIQKGIDPNTKIENTNKHLGFANINLFTCDFTVEGPCKFEFLLHLLRSLHILSTTFLSSMEVAYIPIQPPMLELTKTPLLWSIQAPMVQLTKTPLLWSDLGSNSDLTSSNTSHGIQYWSGWKPQIHLPLPRRIFNTAPTPSAQYWLGRKPQIHLPLPHQIFTIAPTPSAPMD
jgi:hypothetical protein